MNLVGILKFDIINKNEKEEDTLFGRGTESVLHLPPYCDELYDPVVLPGPNILVELHILFAVIQFHDFWFFLDDPALLCCLGLVSRAFLGATFLGPLRQVNGGGSAGMKGGAGIPYPGHEA